MKLTLKKIIIWENLIKEKKPGLASHGLYFHFLTIIYFQILLLFWLAFSLSNLLCAFLFSFNYSVLVLVILVL